MTDHSLPPVTIANCLGEGIVWDERDQSFRWTDIEGRKLFRLSWPDRELTETDLPQRLGSLALTDIDGVILAAFEAGFAQFAIASGEVEWIAKPVSIPGVRFNDGRVDRQGRFVAGTMVEDADKAGGERKGTLWRLEADGSLTSLVEGIGITNALCWSPDGATMYHADTTTGALNAYRYGETAEFDRVVRQFTPEEGWPDGASVDAAGDIWQALWGGGALVCLEPTSGREIDRVSLPASQITCPAFGGPDLDILAATSAWTDLDDARRAAEPEAGQLFFARPGARGLAEMCVRLG
ncbi:L-arabinolactonase [Tsuneonella dongtanensis]|uniref:L-arabinolactonase n=1 Tax=Tsuneonella dongtanensis TaxID=692370 RepID=A0A1B2AB09_9SPHN|nr:SMP-30/gluconolactonase/LRE family protein [Tsuneonella dongtanensis]ANY19350.1 L-arabinolactonase [Tsuneonella dongtanensis]